MTFNILSQNVLLIICSTTVALFVLLVNFLVGAFVVRPKRGKPHYVFHIKNHHLIILLSAPLTSLLLALGIRALIAYYTDSGMDIPADIAFMIMPTSISLVILIAVWLRRPKAYLKIMSIGCLAVSVLFSLGLINSYYRYYPTLGAIFNRNQAIALDRSSTKQVLVSNTSVESAAVLSQSSIEHYFTSISSQPTAGKLVSFNIPGTISRFHARKAYAYIPAAYNNPNAIDLPVVVLTEGAPGAPEDWINSGLQGTMDMFAKHHSGITPLVVVADDSGSINNDTECVDSPRGNVETYLTVDVPNYIKANFNTENDPSHWAIGGLSMGGTCSIMLALRHPDAYRYFLDLGGEMGPEDGNLDKTIKTLFNGSQIEWQQHQPDYLVHTHTYKNMGGFFGVGSNDVRPVTDAAKTLSQDAHAAGMETIYDSYSGGHHSFDVWQQLYRQSLPWLSNRIGATECQTTCEDVSP